MINFIIISEYCSATKPVTPQQSSRTDSQGNGKDIVGQVLTYTCSQGYEFKTAVPATSTDQGLYRNQIFNLKSVLNISNFSSCPHKCNKSYLHQFCKYCSSMGFKLQSTTSNL